MRVSIYLQKSRNVENKVEKNFTKFETNCPRYAKEKFRFVKDPTSDAEQVLKGEKRKTGIVLLSKRSFKKLLQDLWPRVSKRNDFTGV